MNELPDENDWGQCAFCGEPITGPVRPSLANGKRPSVSTLAGPRICTTCDDAVNRKDLSKVRFPVVEEDEEGLV